MRQVEVSRTLVFDAPRRARAFFEALVADNLDIGRPDNVELIFTGPPQRRGRRPVKRAAHPRPSGHPGHRRHRQRLLQALPGQAVPEGRPGAAHRDRRQLTRRPAAATAAWSTWTNCRPRPVPSTAGCSILNASGRVVSLRAQPLSGSRSPRSPRTGGGPRPCGSATLGSWPCSAPCASPQRRRLHQPEPSRPGEPAARHRLHRQPDELRPGPATAQRPHRTHPRHQHLHY